MPKVSVIVPVFKVETYIERCVRSLFRQTLQDVEFLFVDDCTPDQSIKILETLIEEYREHIAEMNWVVRMEQMPTNGGQATVRRYGMQLVTGDYVIQCDSDDWMEGNMLEEMWHKAVHEGLDVVICDFYHDKQNQRIYYKGTRSNDTESIFYEILSARSSWALFNKLFNRRLYDKNAIVYPEDGKNMGEDMLLTVQLLYYSKNAGEIGYISKPLYHYCENQNSITNQNSARQVLMNTLCWKINMYSLEDFLKKKDYSKKAKDSIIFVKYLAKERILPFIDEKKYAVAWRSLFKEINYKILLSPMISRQSKRTYCKNYIRTLFTIVWK